RQAIRHAVSPLDQTRTIAGQVLVCAEVEELGLASQAVGVEVVYWQAGGIFLNEDGRRGAPGTTGFGLQPPRNRPGQIKLSRAERANQGDYAAGEEELPDPATERRRGRQVGQVDSTRRRHVIPRRPRAAVRPWDRRLQIARAAFGNTCACRPGRYSCGFLR